MPFTEVLNLSFREVRTARNYFRKSENGVVKEKPERITCLDIAFKNNDQLKTNTALQMEAEKIDFKVI